IAADSYSHDDDLLSVNDPNLHFASIDELFTPGSSPETNAHGIGKLLENNQVLWVTANSPTTNTKGFTIEIDGDSVLAKTQKPRTLIIEGGNVYLKGNITGEGQLAIILLKNRAVDPQDEIFQRYANLFIAPIVTNIKAAVYAEGSLLTMDDGDRDNDGKVEGPALGIYDGFDDATAWSEVLQNQLYLLGIFATQNTAGGVAKLTAGATTGIEGIPNSAGLFFPPNTSFANYSSAAPEDKIAIAKRFDVKGMRNFARTLVLANDKNSDGTIDDLQSDPTIDCQVVNCVPDPNGPKTWVTTGENAKEALRFDGQDWLDILNYLSDGTCSGCSAL